MEGLTLHVLCKSIVNIIDFLFRNVCVHIVSVCNQFV